MRKGIEANFKGFTAIDDAGRLIGPWNPWLHFRKFGGPPSSSPKLPRPVREIAILVTGAHFHSAYQIYAHVLVAELRGITDEKIRRSLPASDRTISRAKKGRRTIWRQLWSQAACFSL